MSSVTSTSSSHSVERDASSQVLIHVIEKLQDEDRQKVSPFFTQIENYYHQRMDEVHPHRTKRRKLAIVRAAAAYDAFLMFEKRTRVKIRTQFISEALGVAICSMNATWRALFDSRVKVDLSRVTGIYVTDQKIPEIVTMIVHALQKALEKNTPETDTWFKTIETLAIALIEQTSVDGYRPEVIAAAAVYGAVQHDTGISVVSIAKQEIDYACTYSASAINQAWVELFKERSISSIE